MGSSSSPQLSKDVLTSREGIDTPRKLEGVDAMVVVVMAAEVRERDMGSGTWME
jgi:hypothetical protein